MRVVQFIITKINNQNKLTIITINLDIHFFFRQPNMEQGGDCIVPVQIKERLTGRIRLAFYQDDPTNERHENDGICGCLLGWCDRLSVKLTLCWIREEGFDYGHVEMMFSNGVVVSATEKGGGVHVLSNKILSNEGYTRIISVKVSPGTEEVMLEEARKLKNASFNKLGKVWNNIKALETIITIDSGQESFYCSELITYLLKLGAKQEQSDMCKELDHRSTNPTQLYLNLTKNNYGKLDWNEKEALARGMDVRNAVGFLDRYMFRKNKNKSKHPLSKLV